MQDEGHREGLTQCFFVTGRRSCADMIFVDAEEQSVVGGAGCECVGDNFFFFVTTGQARSTGLEYALGP